MWGCTTGLVHEFGQKQVCTAGPQMPIKNWVVSLVSPVLSWLLARATQPGPFFVDLLVIISFNMEMVTWWACCDFQVRSSLALGSSITAFLTQQGIPNSIVTYCHLCLAGVSFDPHSSRTSGTGFSLYRVSLYTHDLLMSSRTDGWNSNVDGFRVVG